MPTYEFRCPLGHEFEVFYRSIGTSQAQAACPICGQLSERMMSAGAGLVFKGSGFYLTDYGKNAHQKKNPADAKGESSGGDGGKSEGGGSSGGESTSGSSGESSGGDSKSESKSESTKSDAKPAESKPAPKPPKPSAGE